MRNDQQVQAQEKTPTACFEGRERGGGRAPKSINRVAAIATSRAVHHAVASCSCTWSAGHKGRGGTNKHRKPIRFAMP